MWQALIKVFVQAFYKANAGFFLFFFFVFFGAVQGGSLLTYHLSLINSILRSSVILLLVLCCWTLYHFKCVSFFIRQVNSKEGLFLQSLQGLQQRRQRSLLIALYVAVYAPVLMYSVFVIFLGVKKGYLLPSMTVGLYQLLSLTVAVGFIHGRVNNWLATIRLPSFSMPIKKTFPLYILYYLFAEKRNALLILKTLSLLLLYLALVWNKGLFRNDSFILFYVVILAAHAVLPYLSVQFMERQLAFSRNLPLSYFQRTMGYLLPYTLAVIPETLYLLFVPNAMPVVSRIAYLVNLPASLLLLTAMQYSGAQSREEYTKAAGAVLFVSIFIFHGQAFWVWIVVQAFVGSVLFISGYRAFETNE